MIDFEFNKDTLNVLENTWLEASGLDKSKYLNIKRIAEDLATTLGLILDDNHVFSTFIIGDAIYHNPLGGSFDEYLEYIKESHTIYLQDLIFSVVKGRSGDTEGQLCELILNTAKLTPPMEIFNTSLHRIVDDISDLKLPENKLYRMYWAEDLIEVKMAVKDLSIKLV